jgi:hypothetical protein
MCVVFFGCSRHVEYGVENLGTNVLDNVIVSTDAGHRFVHGTIISHAHSSFSGTIQLNAKNVVSVCWTDNSGKVHQAKVEVSGGKLTDCRTVMFGITDEMPVEVRWRFPD